MTESSLALQAAILACLKGSTAVTLLVPAANIFDRHARPERFPCVILGEDQVIGEDTDCWAASEVYVTVHVWSRGLGMAEAKQIAGAVRKALRATLTNVADHHDVDLDFDGARFLRDPDGLTAHGVVTFRGFLEEAAA